ncbi:MAG TPA: hypothetical protein DDX98_01365 [Bacteroidales bacterium]|nr:hypothetical protein [Bacteroidales bacterium]
MDIPDLNTQIIYLSFFAAGALLPILFNRIQLHQLAKLYIAAYDTTLILILLAKFGGKAHGSHILFLLFAIIPIFIWSIKERIFIFIFYGLNIGLFLAYEFFNFPLLGQVALPESYFEVTKGITILISYTGATIAIIIFHRLSNIKEEQLQLQNQEIGRQKVELEKLNNKLNEKLQELTQQKNELKQANRIQSKIHSVIAHDLRSPVSSIYRLLEVINTDFDRLKRHEIKEFTTGLSKSSQNTYVLLENLLDWSRMQTKKLAKSPSALSLKNLVEEVLSIYHLQLTKKQLVVETNIDNKLRVIADEHMLSTILRNLISNGIKYSLPKSRITIQGTILKNKKVNILIMDEGIGMDHRIINKLFTIDKKTALRTGTDEEKGSGLGLLICKEFIEKHNSKLLVESKVNEGSTFSFELPLAVS